MPKKDGSEIIKDDEEEDTVERYGCEFPKRSTVIVSWPIRKRERERWYCSCVIIVFYNFYRNFNQNNSTENWKETDFESSHPTELVRDKYPPAKSSFPRSLTRLSLSCMIHMYYHYLSFEIWMHGLNFKRM